MDNIYYDFIFINKYIREKRKKKNEEEECACIRVHMSSKLKYCKNGFQMSVSKLSVDVVFSNVMYSISVLVQWLICRQFFDFQFNKIIFLAIVREISIVFLCLSGKLSISVILPSKQSDGERGILQPIILERFLITDIQNE